LETFSWVIENGLIVVGMRKVFKAITLSLQNILEVFHGAIAISIVFSRVRVIYLLVALVFQVPLDPFKLLLQSLVDSISVLFVFLLFGATRPRTSLLIIILLVLIHTIIIR
jgi:hypothetical protein